MYHVVSSVSLYSRSLDVLTHRSVPRTLEATRELTEHSILITLYSQKHIVHITTYHSM